MTSSTRLAVYDLPPGRTALPDTGLYFACVQSGTATTGGVSTPIDQHARCAGSVDVADGATVWLFEAAPGSTPAPEAQVILSRTGDFGDRSLIRLDCVQSGAGAITPPHRHQGPGIRRLVTGNVLAQADDDFDLIRAGGAWFETGEETIIGSNDPVLDTKFLRLLLLPATLQGGQSSFLATEAMPNAKRNASVTVLAEVMLAPNKPG